MASTDQMPPVPPTPTIHTPKSPKPTLPQLKTPKSATFPILPSELPKSPLPGRLEVMKQEDDDLKTPSTPPTAYTDFLKALSPAVSTPSTSRSPMFDRYSGKSTPITQPSSAVSCSCPSPACYGRSSSSAPMIPPSPFMRPPNSARTPTSLRRLRIPQSPMWSPATDSPKSSALRSPFSPADWNIDGKRTMPMASPASATHPQKSVCVKHVVRRTVTFTSTSLDPAPKGKKRRLE